MRVHTKKKITGLIEELEKTNDLLRKILVKGDSGQLIELLISGQNTAITIGEMLEKEEGESCPAVGLLEDYCESLWQMSQRTGRRELKYCRKGLVEQLKKIQLSIQKIPGRYRVVFLPYKASMWDCMESVWRAAKEDPECDCRVVPIPYCEIHPDGTAGEWHCERDLMPDDVPVTRFEDYQIMEEHPEMIYIHNPYDNRNRVTSVHPAYYSSVLKKCTDMLVYIPYYILRDRLPPSHAYLPAYEHVDRIILQNECMLEDIDPSIPREKLLVLGSPKAERMVWMETHKADINVPEGWKEKLEGKTVFFLNTSITGILNEGEKRLDKVEEIFHIISERQDAALLWRPHPLLEATLKAMRPELLGKYHNLEKQFEKEDLGILDMSPDVERAAALSDAYIGERGSSVVDLFHTVYKPRLIQGTQRFLQPAMDEMRSERIGDVCKIGDDLWFVTLDLQLLCKLNLKHEKTEIVAQVPELPSSPGFHYVGIAYFEGRLVLVPYRADALCVYDIKTGSFTKYYYQDEYANCCFGRIVLYENQLYLTPMDYPALVCFNMKTNQFTYFRQCVRDVLAAAKKQDPRRDSPSPFLRGVGWHGRELYLASAWSSHVLTFDMENHSYKIQAVGDGGHAYCGIGADDQFNWLVPYGFAAIYRWDRATDEVKEYTKFPEGFEPGEIPFQHIVDFGDTLYFLPFQASQSCKMDKLTGEITNAGFALPYHENTFQSEYYKIGGGVNYYFAKKISRHELAAFSCYNRSLVLMDVETLKCKVFPLRIEDYAHWELRKSEGLPLEVRENGRISTAKYIEYLSNENLSQFYRKGIQKPMPKEEHHIGEQIHQAIKKAAEQRWQS